MAHALVSSAWVPEDFYVQLSCHQGQGHVRSCWSCSWRRCANLRCIEAGFVDLCRLIYHGHGCIRNKSLSLQALKKKGKQIKFFSSTSSALSRLHQSKKNPCTPETNTIRLILAPSIAQVSLYVLLVLHNNNDLIHFGIMH